MKRRVAGFCAVLCVTHQASFAAAPAARELKIAILAGNPSAPNLQARSAGVRAEATRRGLEVVEVVHHPETSQDAASAVIKTSRGASRPGGFTGIPEEYLKLP